MNTGFNLEYIGNLLDQIEEKGTQIIDTVELFLEKLKLRREISRVEYLIDEEYIEMGRLLTDLDRLDKEIEIEDFRENFQYVHEQKDYLKILKANLDKLERIIPEPEELEENHREQDYRRCPHCNSLNSIYAAECINCHKEI